MLTCCGGFEHAHSTGWGAKSNAAQSKSPNSHDGVTLHSVHVPLAARARAELQAATQASWSPSVWVSNITYPGIITPRMVNTNLERQNPAAFGVAPLPRRQPLPIPCSRRCVWACTRSRASSENRSLNPFQPALSVAARSCWVLMWSASGAFRVLVFIAVSSGIQSSRRQHVSAFLVPPTLIEAAGARRAASNALGNSLRRSVYSAAAATAGARTKSHAISRLSIVRMSTKIDQAEVDVDVNNRSSGAADDAYKPDRDVESQAYQSTEGWQLKYHDIKTRRDAADAMAKVSVCVFCTLSASSWLYLCTKNNN